MARKGLVLACFSLIAALTLSSCGGVTQSASVAVTTSAATVDGTDAVTLTATVTNDKNSGGVTWGVSGGGTLSNTTTTSATYTAPAATSSALTVTVTATTVADTTKTGTTTITVPAAPAVTTVSSALAGKVGTPYSVQLAGSGGISPYTWTVVSGSTLPAGLSLSTAGVISGTPLVAGAGTTNVTFQMKDSGTATALTVNQTLGVTITAAPAIAFGGVMPATGTYNLAYAGSAAASGGAGTLTYTVNSGALPTGLSLNGASGAVTGTTTSVGTYNFTIKAADAFGDSGTQGYQIVVSYPAVNIAPGAGSLPLAVTGQTYSQSLTASGGSGTGYVWQVSGLSNGLTSSSNGATLTINGPATTTGTVSFTASVTDSASNSAGPLSYSIQVYSPVTLPTTIPSTLASTATVNLPYSGTVAASGGSGNYSWTVTGQSDGLSTSSSGGTLTVSGTPTSAATVTLNVSVKDTTTGVTAGPYTYAITAFNTLTLPSPNPATLGPATLSTPYTGIIVVVGGSGSYSWTVTGLPSGGLNYSATGGTLTISGTPGSTGPVSFGVSVKDNSTNTTAGPFTYSVTAYNALTLPAPNPVSLPSTATVNVAYSGTITASGGSGSGYTYTVTGLPANGLSYASSGGVLTISGTPTTATAVSFGVSAKDSAGLTTGPVTYTVTPYNPLTLPNPNPATLGPATLSLPYSGTIVATGGSGNYSWTVTGLPSDSLNYSATGGTLAISGIPGSATTVSFGVSVKDTTTNVTVGPFNYSVTVYNSVTLPAPNPLSLGPADANSNYSGSITAAGGSGNYSWTVTGLSDGLNYSPSGATLTISGTPTSSATVTFNVSVKDTSTNTSVGPFAYSITVYSALALPPPNPSSLPAGYTSVAYTGTISGSGGSGNYSWQVTGLTDNLSSSPSGGTLTISGTPGATAATVTFNVTLTDTTTNASFTQNGYSIGISVPTPVTLPTPNPASLPSATVNQPYTGSINASGGVPPYTWTVNGVSIPNTGAAVAISDGILVSNNGTNALSVGGTPTAIQTVNLTNVKVIDSIGSNQTNSYTIAVNSAGSQVSGQIFLNNICGSTPPTFTVTINTTPTATTTTTDGSGNYSFTGIPNGTYTITPSIAGASSSLFYPASYTGVTLNNSSNNNVSGENFSAAVAYTVSGTVSYSASGTPQTGQTYLVLKNNTCGGGNGGPGTSVSEAKLTSGGAFTIRGVPPGSYTLTAWMDPIGAGLQNAIDPTGSSAVTVSNANITNAAVAMTDPAYATPRSNPSINGIIPNAQGVLIEYGVSKNSNNIEDANQYVVQWSTSPTLGGGSGGGQLLCTESGGVCPSHTFTANGDKGVWILTNPVAGTGSFASGQTYYFQARSFNTLDTANPHPSGWTDYGGSTLTGVTIGTPSCTGTCTSVSGSVTIPSGITVKSGASLYLGMIELSGPGGDPIGIYATEITNPATGANNFTVTVPNGPNYAVLGILDQNNIGEFVPGVITNVGDKISANITVSGGTMTGQSGTLPTASSVAYVQTTYYQSTSSGGSSTGYQLNFDVSGSNKQPVAVTLNSGPNLPNNSGTVAIDMSNCTECGNPKFEYYFTLPGGTPAVNDTYGFTVTYIDGSQDTGSTISGAVTAFGSTGAVVGASDLATNLSPSANNSTSLTPTFTWTFPANPSDYVYSFFISPTSCSGSCGNVWQIPGNNSKSNGFTYAETGSGTTGTLTWGTDPTGGGSSPTGPLTAPNVYNWQIQVQDANGNQAQTSTWYQP